MNLINYYNKLNPSIFLGPRLIILSDFELSFGQLLLQHLFLGRPWSIFPVGFHPRTVLFIISSLYLCHMSPNHWIICPHRMKLTTSAISIFSCNSLLYFILRVHFSLSYIYWCAYFPSYFTLKNPKL